MDTIEREIAAALRAPFVPDVVRALGAVDRYLEFVWPQLAPSVETQGFLGSALYMADMALDAVEAAYEPVLDRDALLSAGLSAQQLESVIATLDVFHFVQPQLLLLCAALAEGWEQPTVGGAGRPDARVTSEREHAHLETPVTLADPGADLLPELAAALQLAAPPDLYRAVAHWPAYLVAAWDELQHLATYPQVRQRGRGLYYYARSSSRFLAEPLHASREALGAAGLDAGSKQTIRGVLDAALPALSTMMLHCCAMRLALGIREREVVR